MDGSSIQAEKAKAMMRYRRLRSVAKMWRLLELLVALVLLSWSSTRLPLAVQFVTHLYQFLFSPQINFVFVTGNLIVVVVVLLSRGNNAGNNAGGAVDLCDEFVKISEAHQEIFLSHNDAEEIPSLPIQLTPEMEETTAWERKQIVLSDETEVVTRSLPLQLAPETEETACEDKQIVLSENAVFETQSDEVSVAIEQATKQIQRFKRTQSVKLKSGLGAKPNRELRRSETTIKQRTVANSDSDVEISSFGTVEELSSEEFRHTIESFIAQQHQTFLWAQKMDETNYR